MEDLIRDGLIKEEQVKGVTPLDILDGKVGPRVKKLVTDELMKDFGELTRWFKGNYLDGIVPLMCLITIAGSSIIL